MLAVKYHHLRALIHRPYLCYPLLRSMEGGLSAPTTAWSDITLCEKICIAEAHATARLLPSISSQASLVHDFPWWQMISCLVCAGSILVVSSVFSQQTDNEVDGVYAEALSDDAETCLRVFEALSSNSTGARIARNMLEKLKQCGTTWSKFMLSTTLVELIESKREKYTNQLLRSSNIGRNVYTTDVYGVNSIGFNRSAHS